MGENNQVTVVIFVSNDAMHLPGRKKVNTFGLNRVGYKVDLMLACMVDKHANLIITMPVRPIRFVWVSLIVYDVALHLIDLEILEGLSARQSISFDTIGIGHPSITLVYPKQQCASHQAFLRRHCMASFTAER